MAQAQLKTEKYRDARTYCDKALKLDPNSVKGLYRRGVVGAVICYLTILSFDSE